MRKLVFIFLLLAAMLLILPCIVFSQTAMRLDMNVHRIPVTGYSLIKCEPQRVLLYFEKGMMGVATEDDTLQLRRIKTLESQYGRSVVFCHDELHRKQPYTVMYVQDRTGFAMYITPLLPQSTAEQKKHLLFSIIITTEPCN